MWVNNGGQNMCGTDSKTIVPTIRKLKMKTLFYGCHSSWRQQSYVQPLQRKMSFDIKIHEDQLFVNIDNLLNNFDDTLKRVRLIKERMGQQHLERKRFQWSRPLLEEFAVIVSREGITDVKPSQLEESFPQLQNSQLGSHL